MNHYRKMSEADVMLPQLLDTAHYLSTVLSGNHFTLIARAFYQRVRTTSAVAKLGVADDKQRLCLAKLAEVDPEFAQYIRGGLRSKHLKTTVLQYPHQLEAIQGGFNNDMKNCGTEAELLKKARARLFSEGPGSTELGCAPTNRKVRYSP